MNRRSFIKTSGVLAGSCLAPVAGFPAVNPTRARVYKAAIIGRTGGGNYGHGLDVIFNGLDRVTVAAVADADPAGRKQAAERSGADRQYADYRQMLEKEKPDLVSIGPRQPDCHPEMALAAIEAGANIYMEKPMTESPAEADAIIEAAEKQGVKIGIAHTRRYSSEFTRIKGLIEEGFLGEVREMRVRGKQDARVGGEDMMVLGTHDFDLMRFYFRDPKWAFAGVRSDGRDITKEDVRQGHEPIWVAGDTIHATYAFPDNIQTFWSSVKTEDSWNRQISGNEKWSFAIYGTERIIAHRSAVGFGYLDSAFALLPREEPKWQPLPEPKQWAMPDHAKHPIRDLIHAIETDGQPVCSGYDGRWAIEMVAAVYQSQKKRGRVALPLKERVHPLLEW